jgi:sugar phosphate isomerase/epimerase
MKSAVTISLVPESRGGPFVFWDNLSAGCAAAAKHGFDAVELFLPSAGSLKISELEGLLAKHKLTVAAFGTGAGWVKHRLRLTDPDARIRREAEEFIGAFIDLGAAFDAPAILGSMQGRWGEGVKRQQAVEWLAESMENLGARAKSHGVTFLYEPLNRYETNLFNRVSSTVEFLGLLRAKNIRILCDLFHMNIEERDIAAALRAAGRRLGHVHFADTNRHAVGLGHLDVAPVAKMLKDMNYEGFVSAEIFPLPDSDTAAKQTMASFRKAFGRK